MDPDNYPTPEDDWYPDEDEDDSPEGDEEWKPGECDNCYGGDENGVTANSPFGPIYCACFIGQGAPEDECRCGPPANDQGAIVAADQEQP